MNNKCKNYSKCVEILVTLCLCNITGRELVGVPDCDNCNMALDMKEDAKSNEKIKIGDHEQQSVFQEQNFNCVIIK